MSRDRTALTAALLGTLCTLVAAPAAAADPPPVVMGKDGKPKTPVGAPENPAVQPAPAPGAPDLGAPPANAISTNPVAQLGTFEEGGKLFGHAAFGAAYDKPAFAGALGGKLSLSPGWMVGLDVEWNPWASINSKKIRDGVLNIYGSIIRRYQMRYEAVNLRTTLALGTSTLLFDLYGAPKGTTGAFVGVSFLGVEWKVAKGWYIVLDPSYLALPVPHLSGVPLGYLQYRVTVGLDVVIF